jgi:hypothetical protein
LLVELAEWEEGRKEEAGDRRLAAR